MGGDRNGSGNQFTWLQTYPTYVLAIPSEGTINIYDDEPPQTPFVSVFALDSIATETANDCATVSFIRFGPFDQDLTVYYTVSGAASNGIDYVALPGVITIPARATIDQPADHRDNDLFVEGNRRRDDHSWQTTRPGATSLIPAGPVYYIVDDDLPLLSVYAPDSIATRTGNNGRLPLCAPGTCRVIWVVKYLVTGSAVAGVDYVYAFRRRHNPCGSGQRRCRDQILFPGLHQPE